MLSKLHEALLLLFRDRPTLAPEVLRDTLRVPLPDFTEARVESSDLTEAVPRELRADHVIGLYNGATRVLSIVVEAQLKSPDKKKLRAWVGYVAGSFTRNRCQACLLVVTTRRAVAARSAQPIVIGPQSVIGPFVLGPGSVPVITADEQARSMPEVAVLSAMAHGRSKVGPQVALAALAGLAGLEEEHAMLYGDVMLSCLHEAAKRALEAMMASGEYEIQSKFLKKYIAKGKKEGRAEGKAEGRAEAVLEVLEARGVAIPDDVRERIVHSTDLAALRHWLRRAAVVSSAREIFDETP
jgi:hypothetical protein